MAEQEEVSNYHWESQKLYNHASSHEAIGFVATIIERDAAGEVVLTHRCYGKEDLSYLDLMAASWMQIRFVEDMASAGCLESWRTMAASYRQGKRK